MKDLSKDELWKGAIEDLIVPFIKFFFPKNAHEIDWEMPIEFMDTELPKIIRGLRNGKRTADRLIKVFLKNGEPKYFLIHVEVQSQEDLNLSDRMYKMFYRIYDRFNVDVTALAILAYKGAKESSVYRQSFWGTKLDYSYNTYNLIKEVEKGNIDDVNIFSLIIRSVYLDMKYNENEISKYEGKLKLLEDFLKRKPTSEEYQCLLNFIIMFVR